MKAFVEHLEKIVKSETGYDRFTKWLILITQKEIRNKETIREICEEGDIKDAMDALRTLSEDKIKRQAYQRRLDQVYFYNKTMAEKDAALAEKDATLAEKDAIIAELLARLGEQQD